MESILTSIRKLLGPDETYTHFDPDIIIHINSALSILNQLGVGPSAGFSICSESETWSDFLGDDSKKINYAKTYVYLKVRLIFDPPTSSAVIESMNRTISELEWRLQVESDQVSDTTI